MANQNDWWYMQNIAASANVFANTYTTNTAATTSAYPITAPYVTFPVITAAHTFPLPQPGAPMLSEPEEGCVVHYPEIELLRRRVAEIAVPLAA